MEIQGKHAQDALLVPISGVDRGGSGGLEGGKSRFGGSKSRPRDESATFDLGHSTKTLGDGGWLAGGWRGSAGAGGGGWTDGWGSEGAQEGIVYRDVGVGVCGLSVSRVPLVSHVSPVYTHVPTPVPYLIFLLWCARN